MACFLGSSIIWLGVWPLDQNKQLKCIRCAQILYIFSQSLIMQMETSYLIEVLHLWWNLWYFISRKRYKQLFAFTSHLPVSVIVRTCWALLSVSFWGQFGQWSIMLHHYCIQKAGKQVCFPPAVKPSEQLQCGNRLLNINMQI